MQLALESWKPKNSLTKSWKHSLHSLGRKCPLSMPSHCDPCPSNAANSAGAASHALWPRAWSATRAVKLFGVPEPNQSSTSEDAKPVNQDTAGGHLFPQLGSAGYLFDDSSEHSCVNLVAKFLDLAGQLMA